MRVIIVSVLVVVVLHARWISATPLSSNATTSSSPSTTLKPVALPLLQQAFEQPEKCREFVDSSTNEFHTPNYPGEYFDQLNCVKVISAGPGEVIRLRFLDHFHLEPDEKCRYDYLEIRDGQFGYSTLIDTLCGTSPPTVIESSGRHLWLRFHSDLDIHYIGFRAFYEFVPSSLSRPDLDDCAFHLTSLESNVTSEELPPEILMTRKEVSMFHLDCTWLIEAPAGQKIHLQFRDFALEKANDCTFNFVEIYGSRTELYGKDGLLQQYCGSDTKPLFSNTNVLHLRFYTALTIDAAGESLYFSTKLSLYYNFYRDLQSEKGSTTEEPDKCREEEEEFDCTDNTCISKDLVCNYQANCKQGNDEDKVKCKGQKATFQMTMDLIVIAFIGCFLAAGMCSGLILNICRKLRQDKLEMEEIRASLHKSKDSSLGTGPPKTNRPKDAVCKEDLKFVQEVRSEPTPPPPPPQQQQLQLQKKQHLHVAATTPPSQNSSNESGNTVIFKEPIRRAPEQPTTTTTIPYSPPPPYPSKVAKHEPDEHENDDEHVQVIEVRDCACQTRESFTEKYLRDVYFGTTRHYSREPHHHLTAPKRAPLARSEAVDADAGSTIGFKKQLRKAPRGPADVLMYPRAPASVCSSVDASTGSLELLHELDEAEEPHHYI